MKVLSLALFAALFAPTTGLSTTTTSDTATGNRRFDNEFGVTIETGLRCPPLGAQCMETENGNLQWWQNAELKHGRVAMVATIGYYVQKSGIYFAGSKGADLLLSNSEEVTFAAISKAAPLDAISMIPANGLIQILFFAGVIETYFYDKQFGENAPDDIVPGNYGYDPLGYTKVEGGWKSEKLTEMRMRELKNGRLAMLAIAAWVANDAIPGALPFWHP